MLEKAEFVRQIERQYLVFVDFQSGDKNDEIFVIRIHSKLIECGDNIQTNEIFTTQYFIYDFFNERERIPITFDHSIQFSVIHTES